MVKPRIAIVGLGLIGGSLARRLVNAGCEVTADTTIRLGGLRAKCGAVEADDTLDMKLEAQKDWFLQNSGMSIAL